LRLSPRWAGFTNFQALMECDGPVLGGFVSFFLENAPNLPVSVGVPPDSLQHEHQSLFFSIVPRFNSIAAYGRSMGCCVFFLFSLFHPYTLALDSRTTLTTPWSLFRPDTSVFILTPRFPKPSPKVAPCNSCCLLTPRHWAGGYPGGAPPPRG